MLYIGGSPRIDRTSFSSNITDESFIILGQKFLKLVDIPLVTNIGIAALARGCPQLRSFYAHCCPSISANGIMALSHGCKELRAIDLRMCGLITDSLIRSAEGCPDLTSLTLIIMNSVTSAGISCLARGCEKLLYITIKDCSQIDDTALIAIGSSCPNLLGITVIALVSYVLSDRGLIAIACGCPALESIAISDCPNVTDAGVIVLALKCCQLKSIFLTSSEITDASLIAFATNSRKLQSVLLDSCHYITSSGLSVLAAECTQMRSMNFKTSRKVGEENLLSLRRKYLLTKTSEHNRHTSVLSMLWHFIPCK